MHVSAPSAAIALAMLSRFWNISTLSLEPGKFPLHPPCGNMRWGTIMPQKFLETVR